LSSVGDTAIAAIEFLAAVRRYLSVVTRLRLDANLYAPAPRSRCRHNQSVPAARRRHFVDHARIAMGIMQTA
jgi:hypothetical protein